MRTLYLECNMGAAGDMLTAALSELHPDAEGFIKRLNAAGIPDVWVTAEKTQKCGITGTHIRVDVHGTEESELMHEHAHHHTHREHAHSHGNEHAHPHSGINDIESIINGLDISDTVKEHACAVYRIIAEAESRIHGVTMENIHFHEVGTADAVTDVVAVCMLIDELAPGRIICSPICTGSGTVRCAHGILPVPAPATEYILRGIPVYGGDIKGELCTPTGAALIKHFASDFGSMPVMCVSKTGYGMGTKDFDTANCVRAMLGEWDDPSYEVCELRCNIDDMTGEHMAFAAEALMKGGALDVFTAPIYMKKNRPGMLLTCLCRIEDRERILGIIFRHTTTIGVREYPIKRHVLDRHETTLSTPYGNVRAKESSGYGISRIKPEYEDMAEIARKNNIPIGDIKIKDHSI